MTSNGHVRFRLVAGLAAALALGFSVSEARAAPIPTQITYSTSAPEPLRAPGGEVVFEFQPVTDGVAMLGTDLKLGTILIHRHETVSRYMFPGVAFPIGFEITRADGATLPAGEGRVEIENFLYGTVREDGKIDGGFAPFVMDGLVLPLSGGAALALKPVAVDPLWNLGDSPAVVGIDVFARLEGAPVPEPGTWLIFAAAAGLGARRLGRRSRRG